MVNLLRDERGGIMIYALLFMLILIPVFAFLGDLGAEVVLQAKLGYALETALDDAATQGVDGNALSHGCLVLDYWPTIDAFRQGLMASLRLTPGPAYWAFSPPQGDPTYTGPIQVDGIQVYNTNYLTSSTDSQGNVTYSCPTTPALGTTTPWGTVVDRPSVYADIQVPVRLPTGRRVTLEVFRVLGANQ